MTQAYDANGDGIYDSYATDTNGDGYAETIHLDQNQDGCIDGAGVDANADGYMETVGGDFNQDGRYETVVTNGLTYVDTDGDGLADTQQTTYSNGDYTMTGDTFAPSGVVGGTPSYDGVGGLVVDMAGQSGTAAWSDGDYDGDGIYDSQDSYPSNPEYY